jgi:hypothetical protein
LYFDNNKNKILELEYYRASPFSDGISVVSEYEGAKYGAIDIGGNYIIPPEYDSLGMFFDGYGRFWTDRKFGFINKNNEMIIPNIYELAKDYSEGCVPVKLNEKWGYVDENNKALIAFVFEDANSFSENVATVKENGLWGVIDHNGEYIISPQYPYLSRCFNGLIMVSDENNNFLYYINLNGEIIKPKL